MPDPIETNRPPFVPDETLISPTAPAVTVNLECLRQAADAGQLTSTPEFILPVADQDVDQTLEAAFFLDYDFGAPSPAALLGGRERLTPTGEIRRADAHFDALHFFHQNLEANTVSTLEVFVLEANALDPDGDPLDRAQLDCTADGAPADCIFSTPLTWRWSLEIIDEACP